MRSRGGAGTRLGASRSRMNFGLPTAIAAAICLLSSPVQSPPTRATVFQNVRIFDGKSGKLSPPMHVLVRGNRIERISSKPLPTDRRADTVLIDGGGRTLMPGLIDNHWHTLLVRPTPTT